MRIENVEIEYMVDYINRCVHMADKSRHQFQGLLNVMSPEFQTNVIEGEGLLIDVMDFDWICYGSGGLIMEFKECGLVFVSKEDNRLHKPYMNVSGLH
jgi:hypothetical protein